MRAVSTSGRRYYRDSTRIDHVGDCEQLSAYAEEIEAQVADFLSHIQLPEDWPNHADEWLGTGNTARNPQAQRRWERAKELYLSGDMEREQYETEKKLYESSERDLTGYEPSAPMALGDMIHNFAQECAKALPIEKRKLLRFAIAAAFVWDNTLVAIQPTPALFPLVSRFIEESHCICGDDGIRTRGLGLDRAAC
jgi:hypothetical protein